MTAWAIEWAIRQGEAIDGSIADAARAELADLEAVVAAQREALRGALRDAEARGLTDATFWVRDVRAALDAEGVSEPGGLTSPKAGIDARSAETAPGSLTSPVDTAP